MNQKCRSCQALPQNSTREASRWLWVPGHMMAASKGSSFYSYPSPQLNNFYWKQITK